MSELGSGSGSSYPAAIDTDNTLEVNSPNAGKTKARAECINDLNAAVVAIQTELGTDPAGTLTNVKTFLQTEHGTNGTHAAITATSLTSSGAISGTNLSLSGSMTAGTVPLARMQRTEVSGTGSSASITLDVGTVSTGDRILVFAKTTGASQTGNLTSTISKSSGTATITVPGGGSSSTAGVYVSAAIPYVENTTIINVTGGGTLVIQISNNITTPTIWGQAIVLNNG